MSSTQVLNDYFNPRALRLAYERANRWSDRLSKDRPGLRAYGYDLDAALADLSERIIAGAYRPQLAFKYFEPKASGTQRTKTLLTIEDALVYQAIANGIAARSYAKVSKHDQFVFGSVLNEEVAKGEAILDEEEAALFFFKYWKGPFEQFKSSIADVLHSDPVEGVDPITHKFVTDITGFFDAIPHYNLLNVLQEEFSIEDEILELLSECLNAWCGTKLSPTPGVGIPQGPQPSYFLANLLLYRLDDQIVSVGIPYYRYMDDIHMYAYAENDLRNILIDIDVHLKGLGLSLNTKKTSIELVTEEDVRTSEVELAQAKVQLASYAADDEGVLEAVIEQQAIAWEIKRQEPDASVKTTHSIFKDSKTQPKPQKIKVAKVAQAKTTGKAKTIDPVFSGLLAQDGVENAYDVWERASLITDPQEILKYWTTTYSEAHQDFLDLFDPASLLHGVTPMVADAAIDTEFIGAGVRMSSAIKALRELGNEVADPNDVKLWVAALRKFPSRTQNFFYSVAAYPDDLESQMDLLYVASDQQKYEWVRYIIYDHFVIRGSFSDKQLRDTFKVLQLEESALARSALYRVLLAHSKNKQLLISVGRQLDREPNSYVRLLVTDWQVNYRPDLDIKDNLLATIGI